MYLHKSGAFSGIAITEISIPESVTEIESEAFGNCKSLTKVTMPTRPITMEEVTVLSCIVPG
ncbi:MAG: leucine-rich repeat domain-containing protein [Treponema sp.]|nr:leucine-rich repeat domain-containing protein [Treponema sp.]